MQLYNKLSKGYKRLVWAGYAAYLIWIFAFDGGDTIINNCIRPLTNNDLIALAVMLILYWPILFLILWVKDGFD